MTDIPPVLAKSTRFAPIAKLTGRFFNLPTWKATVWHVDSVEAAMFPFLAEMLGITETDGWQKAQTEQERRAIIKGAYARSRTRGTATGLRQAAAESGGQVRRIIAPPNKLYLSAAASTAERNAWLSKHPELRLYPRRVPGHKEVAMLGSEFLNGNCYPAKSTALVRSRLRATLVKDGIETEVESPSWQIATKSNQAITEVVIPGKRGYASFTGSPLRFIAATDSSNRRIVLQNVALYQEQTATLGLRTLASSLTPMDVDGEMVSVIRQGSPAATFLGRFPRHTASLDAALSQYRRIRLFDPMVPVVRSRAAAYLGYSRLTMPPHCAQVEVAIFGKRKPTIARFCGQPIAKSSREQLNKLLANMRLASRASDSITIDTRIFRPVRAGHIMAGNTMAGGFSNH